VLFLGGLIFLAEFGRHGGCGGSEADRSLVADLQEDPLITALPPGATTTQQSTTYSCPGSPGRAGMGTTSALAVKIVKQAHLTNPISLPDLHQYFVKSVGLNAWRLVNTEKQSISYCRVIGSYRVVSMMTLDSESLTKQVLAWTDGAGCAAEVPSPA
jgi:hypothetical protein